MSPELAERAQKYLMASVEEMQEAGLPVDVRRRMLRLREIYAYWIEHPRLLDKNIVARLRKKHGLGVTQAYEDVKLVKICIGNLARLTRDYDRYILRCRCEEGWAMARKAGDAGAFAKVTQAYGKYTQLDKDENLGPDYSQIVPQTFTITADPAAAGFKVVPGILERARRLEERYLRETEAVESDFEELPDGTADAEKRS